jgi:hypothetical protein
MPPFAISLPGVQRLRAVHPLIDDDGGCSLVYDAERGAALEVPEELRFHVAPALDMGDLDEELLGWLASEDLLTGETFGDWSGAEPGLADLRGEEMEGWVDCAPGGRALDDLDLAFRCARGCARIKLHLDWVGMFPAGGLLETLVGEALRRAALAGQEVSFELALDPQQVTPEVARRLAAQPVGVRLRCGESDLAGPPTAHENRPWLLAEPAVKLLLAHLAPGAGIPAAEAPAGAATLEPCAALEPQATPADFLAPRSPRASLTVQCVLDGAARLVELWRWANALGICRLDAIRLEEPGVSRRGGASPRLREYRQDLLAIQEEIAGELDAGRLPVELQSFTRIVRALVRNAGLANLRAPGNDSAARAGFLPMTGTGSFDPRQIPDEIWQRLERWSGAERTPGTSAATSSAASARPASPATPASAAHTKTVGTRASSAGAVHRVTPAAAAEPGEAAESELAGLPCRSCWAGQVCSHSALVTSPLANEDPRDRSRETCAIWASEVEAAIRLHHRLAQIDPIQVQTFLAGDAGAETSPPASLAPWSFAHLLRLEPS